MHKVKQQLNNITSNKRLRTKANIHNSIKNNNNNALIDLQNQPKLQRNKPIKLQKSMVVHIAEGTRKLNNKCQKFSQCKITEDSNVKNDNENNNFNRHRQDLDYDETKDNSSSSASPCSGTDSEEEVGNQDCNDGNLSSKNDKYNNEIDETNSMFNDNSMNYLSDSNYSRNQKQYLLRPTYTNNISPATSSTSMMCPCCQYQFFIRNSLTRVSNISSDSGFCHFEETSNASTNRTSASNSNFNSFDNGVNNNETNTPLNIINKFGKCSISCINANNAKSWISHNSTCLFDEYCECSLNHSSQLYRNVQGRWSDGRIQQKTHSYLARKQIPRPSSYIMSELKNADESLTSYSRRNTLLKGNSEILSKLSFNSKDDCHLNNNFIENKIDTNLPKEDLILNLHNDILNLEEMCKVEQLNKRLNVLKNNIAKHNIDYQNDNESLRFHEELERPVDVDSEHIRPISRPLFCRSLSKTIICRSPKHMPSSRHSTSSLAIENIIRHQVLLIITFINKKKLFLDTNSRIKSFHFGCKIFETP